MKNFILCFSILICTVTALRADAVTFEATVNSSRVSLDEVLQLNLTFTGINDNLDPVSLPVIDGFSAKYLGPSTSVSIVNGVYNSSRSFSYNLFPNKVGRFQIPAISATISGQTYRTKPIDVEVFQSSPQAQASNAASDQGQVPNVQSLKDKILVLASVDESEVYLNQRIPLTIKLLINDVPVRDIQYPQFDKAGLFVDAFEKPGQGAQLLNGIRYDTVEFKTNIYPNRLGDLTVGPIQIQGNVLYKTGQSNPFNQDNSSFGVDIFNSFFDSYATLPISKTSQAIHLHVSGLPEENRPNDFSGAIGQFDFQANVSGLHVKAGDPLTLKMSVKGSGNFKNLKMPVFQASGFKSYPPQIKEIGNEKKLEEIIIPTSAGIKEVPALRFSYFDTFAKDYKTITQGPFSIKVTAPSPDQEFKAIGFSDVSKETLTPPTNQFSFRKAIHRFHQVLRRLWVSIYFWFYLGIAFMAGVSFIMWRRFKNRLEKDPAFARRLKAVREAKQALKPAEGHLSKAQTKDFYALLSKVLRDYLANKWHQSSASLSAEDILSHLKSVNLDQTHIEQVKSIMEQSDMVCFASAVRDASQMHRDLLQTKELIAFLEKILK